MRIQHEGLIDSGLGARKRRLAMRDGFLFLSGVAAGAAVTYLVDPHQGARRRAELKDRAVSASRTSGRRGLKLLRHLRNQAEGVLALAVDLVTPSAAVSDRKLADRIRSTLGHSCAHLASVELEVRQGNVIVKGSVPEEDLQTLLKVISGTKGVRSVTDSLQRGPIASSEPIQ